MPEYFRPHSVGHQITWPQPWELASPVVDWQAGARERRPAKDDRAAQAAQEDLTKTLQDQPTTFWSRIAAEFELAGKYRISALTARMLIRDTPGSALVDGGEVWCAAAIAGQWAEVKARVLAAVPAERLATFDEVHEAAGTDIAPASMLAALNVLYEQDLVASVQDSRHDGGPYFCKARPGNADYLDLYEARVGRQAA